MKKHLLTILALLPVVAMADEVNVVYGTFTLASGATVEARLYDDSTAVLPMVRTAEKTITINGKAYSLDNIESVRFDVRKEELSAINNVVAIDGLADGNVYTLGGTLVRKGGGEKGNLPKGVYIMNKKKIVVK